MITNTRIAWGDQLGAQMSSLANLYYISKENNQKIIFFKELESFRRGYQFLDVFNMKDIDIVETDSFLLKLISKRYVKSKYNNLSWKSKYQRIYKSRVNTYIDRIYYYLFSYVIKNKYHIYTLGFDIDINSSTELLHLDSKNNYDIWNCYGTYSDYCKYAKEIINEFSFKQSIIDEAYRDKLLIDIISNQNSISVHFRKTDYLLMSSLNLDSEYYKEALSYFNQNDYFIIFSDDIQQVKKEGLFEGGGYKNVIFVEGKSAGCNMYLMSLCKNNIIANSNFSFWGALLNKNNNKKVVCPYEYIGKSAPEYMYMNGKWFPKEWTSIHVMN